MPLLIAMAGLPGSGKSTVARELARRTDAIWLRIDSIDEAIRASGVVPGDLKDVGYRAAHAVALDNLRLGRDVISDCVNDWILVRDGWEATAAAAGAQIRWLEIACSDPAEHRRRVETRPVEVPGQVPPTWADVKARDYHAWDRPRITLDTAGRTLDETVVAALAALGFAR
jgi:predicted kinase